MRLAGMYMNTHGPAHEHTIAVVRVVIDGATGFPSAVHVEAQESWSLSEALASVIADAVCASSFAPFTRERFEVQFPFRL